jgi:citrate lyase subunit beta/citryl-CoA lyase
VKRWRSLLFVPADNSKALSRAHERHADALILDLEDAVAPADKASARATLGDHVGRLNAHGVDVLVRVNADLPDLTQDIAALVRPGVSAIVLPKVEDPAQLIMVDRLLSDAEAKGDMPSGSICIIALIESPAAILKIQSFAVTARLIGFALGSEDFSLALGTQPTPDCLTLPCQMLALAASAAGVMAIGLPDTLTQFGDLSAYERVVTKARAVGMTGVFCIHPTQVACVNRAFAPTEADQLWAQGVITATDAAAARGVAVASYQGQMIDRPVLERAKAIRAQV